MMKKMISIAALALIASGCGNTQEQRAATGALAGGGVGLLFGPVGALVGLAGGGLAGAVMDEGADRKIARMWDERNRSVAAASERSSGTAAGAASARAPGGATNVGSAAQVPPEKIKEIQSVLQDRGLYDGPVDGIVGPKTKTALSRYQRYTGLPQTADLDPQTMASLEGSMSGAAANQAEGSPSNVEPRPGRVAGSPEEQQQPEQSTR